MLTKYVNKLNWKEHTKRQKDYMGDSIQDAGWAKNTIFCANTDRVIDGHGRIKVSLEKNYTTMPVDVGWWTKEQGDILLATLDPLSQMANVDANALQSLTLSNIKALTAKKKNVGAMKDVNSFAAQIISGKKDKLGIRASKRSASAIINKSKTTTRDKRETTTDNDDLYDTALRSDVTFPATRNEYGLPDLLQSKLYNPAELPASTFARCGNSLRDDMFYCQGSRPFDSGKHLKPIGGVLGFYCEDSRIDGLYRNGTHWAEKLVGEQWFGILEPDFSTYWDWPFAKRLWSVYRSRWCARYWQQLGMSVLPILRRTNDLERDKWMYSSLPGGIHTAAMQLRMGGKKNRSREEYWNGVGAVLEYMVSEHSLKRVMFYGGETLEKYVAGFTPKGLEYTMVEPFVDARRRMMNERAKKN